MFRLALCAAVLKYLTPPALLQTFRIHLLPFKNEAVGADVQPNDDAHLSQFFKRVWCRVAKCHGYDGSIRVKISRGWGKKSERTHNMTKLGLF